MNNENKLIEIKAEELSKVDNNLLNENQLSFILKKTPKNHIYQRPGKGGGKWQYVTGTYIKKVLNLVFGWDWSFEIIEHKIDINFKQAYVLGKLTVNSANKQIVKMQFGRVDIKFKTEAVFDEHGQPVMIDDKYNHGKKKQKRQSSNVPLDVGNDLKAAATDALKKCAAELGIASDVYAPNEFKEIKILQQNKDEIKTQKLNELKDLFENNDFNISEDDKLHIQRVIDQKEFATYDKAIKLLKQNIVKH